MQPTANVLGELGTCLPGPGLTPLGDHQAAAAPDVFEGRKVDAIFGSLMVRTHLTAAPLAAARRLQPVGLDGIYEVEAGDLEDRSDAVDIYQDVLACWAGGDTEASIPGGPDGAAFLGRFDASVAAVLRSGAATAVVFSHGASIRPWRDYRRMGTGLTRDFPSALWWSRRPSSSQVRVEARCERHPPSPWVWRRVEPGVEAVDTVFMAPLMAIGS